MFLSHPIQLAKIAGGVQENYFGKVGGVLQRVYVQSNVVIETE